MEVLKFNLDIPYWCSFSDFSSLKIKLTYPFPPPTTIFGMILNSMDKPSIHTIHPMKCSDKEKEKHQKKLKDITEQSYLDFYNNLSFAIVINNFGEIIEDYSNIHKINRIDNIESDIIKKIIKEYNKQENDEIIEKNIKEISKHDFYLDICLNHEESDNEIVRHLNKFHSNLLDNIKKEWELNYKIFMGTLIKKQKIINPSYTVYVKSDDEYYNLDKIKYYLENPINPLYIGESDDLININNIEVVELNKITSNNINSVVSELCLNSELVKIPCKLKFDKDGNHQKTVSILNDYLDEDISCYTDGVNNIVFL